MGILQYKRRSASLNDHQLRFYVKLFLFVLTCSFMAACGEGEHKTQSPCDLVITNDTNSFELSICNLQSYKTKFNEHTNPGQFGYEFKWVNEVGDTVILDLRLLKNSRYARIGQKMIEDSSARRDILDHYWSQYFRGSELLPMTYSSIMEKDQQVFFCYGKSHLYAVVKDVNGFSDMAFSGCQQPMGMIELIKSFRRFK